MKQPLRIFFFLAGITSLSPALAEYSYTPFPHYKPPSAVYVTVGGGVTGLENSDFYRHPNLPGYLQVRQPSDKDNVVGAVNGALGYQFGSFPMRIEAAYHWYSKADYDWNLLYFNYNGNAGSGTIESETVLFNVYLDWYNKTRFTPFIGGGVGYYNNRSNFTLEGSGADGTAQANNNDGTAWGASVGVKYEITPNWLVDIRADYVYLGAVQIEEIHVSQPKELMKTNHIYAISALLNVTYAYNFL